MKLFEPIFLDEKFSHIDLLITLRENCGFCRKNQEMSDLAKYKGGKIHATFMSMNLGDFSSV